MKCQTLMLKRGLEASQAVVLADRSADLKNGMMAFYIEMEKLSETGEYVEYSFGRGNDVGIVRFDKRREAISIVSDCPLDIGRKWAERASMKLAMLWREGVFPEQAHWAS